MKATLHLMLVRGERDVDWLAAFWIQNGVKAMYGSKPRLGLSSKAFRKLYSWYLLASRMFVVSSSSAG